MKLSTHHSVHRNKASILLLAVAVIAANLMPSGLIGKAAAKSGGLTLMAGPAPSKTQTQIDRTGGVRAPAPVSVKEPCKPGPGCRPRHDHTH